jgi:hypothetical protein
MKNKNLLIIGAVVIAAFFFFKKKKTATIAPTGPTGPTGPVLNDNDKTPPPPPPPPPPNDRLFPIDMLPKFTSNNYPGGLVDGMRVKADNGDEQQILEDGKLWGLTYDQWAARGFDAWTTVNSDILNQIPYGGVYQGLK